ncbi:hypothetical protein TSUD_77250 [Trifolium subterraneum]|uniref:Reverse transcriptase domain-containing protein n=1 Tax=Trifolium subterraneum TaxID=3900 RepID=A0A2Z6LSR2_TRISU|nr:hypothetical protein TSUD_77250 [Trifolium subterraneum]
MVRSERESGAAPRAFLGRPFRSPPSPEARHKRGGVSVDRGEWTVVRNRRRKALREEEEGEDRRRQNQASSNYQTAAFFKPSKNSDVDHNYGYHSRAREHHLLGLNQKRYIRGRSREFRRQDSSYRDGWGYRSVSRSRSRYGWGRNHRASWSGWGRRKQDDVEGDGRLRNGWKCDWNTTAKEFETKLFTCDDFLCTTLWGNSPHSFSYRPSVGASGGLLTLWDSAEVEVWSTESREHVLWCHGRLTKSGEEFYVANVYAPCDDGAKEGLWGSLTTRIQSLGRRSVCVCGDFNAVKHVDERRSSRGVSRSLDHIPFNRFIDDNNLIDLPLNGRKFTWFKGDGLSMSRLDRFLLSEEWCLAWPNCTQTARLRGLSDHCSLVLSANEDDWGPRPLRMLKCWRDVPGYQVFVKEKWKELQVDGWGGYVLKEKLRRIKTTLKDWHTTHTQNLPSRIDSLKDRLSILDQKGEDEALSEAELAELHGVSSGIYSLSRLHASISWQQSRSLWLKEGDANSKQAVFSHFASHFRAISMDRPGIDNLQFKRLNQLESSSLITPFSEAEVKSAVWDCDSFKSPGPDGVNFGFIKDFWADIRAFVKDRQILDGILIANEAVDEARRSKKELMLFKVDFEKAYDSVDWGYLEDVMGRMSFPTLWRKWIKECVCTATASVLVNGSPTEEFPLGRGLRQGDPLSPFLFLLAAEGLNVLMEAAVDRNLFTGYSIGERDPISVSHLQFADDTLLLGIKSWANVRALRAILGLFETMSGLKVNFHKSMLVGVNIPESWLGEAASALRCKVGIIPFLYLGLPIGGDPRRLGFWEPVLARLKNRLSGWKSRFLSFGGRLVLLKSVLQSLPVYALSFFKAPTGIISSIESIFIKFFWGGCEDSRKIPWVSWKSICLSKEGGGLGVRQMREFNLALLGKWCWRMLVDREGLWFRVLVARYGMERGRIRDGGRRGSTWWREIACIQRGSELGSSWFGEQVSRRVGDGLDTFFWTDPWVEGVPLWWGVDGEAWQWWRELWVWEEEMLRECQSLLLNLTLQDRSSDRWQWQPDPDEGYTVRGAYQLLTQGSATTDVADKLIWHSQVPLKVSILAWRLLRDSRWVPAAAFLYAAYLARVCMGCVDRKKSSLIPRLSEQPPSVVGQD